MVVLLALLLGTALGALLAWLALRSRGVELRVALHHERRAADEKLALVERSRAELEQNFRALSAEQIANTRPWRSFAAWPPAG